MKGAPPADTPAQTPALTRLADALRLRRQRTRQPSVATAAMSTTTLAAVAHTMVSTLTVPPVSSDMQGMRSRTAGVDLPSAEKNSGSAATQLRLRPVQQMARKSCGCCAHDFWMITLHLHMQRCIVLHMPACACIDSVEVPQPARQLVPAPAVCELHQSVQCTQQKQMTTAADAPIREADCCVVPHLEQAPQRLVLMQGGAGAIKVPQDEREIAEQQREVRAVIRPKHWQRFSASCASRLWAKHLEGDLQQFWHKCGRQVRWACASAQVCNVPVAGPSHRDLTPCLCVARTCLHRKVVLQSRSEARSVGCMQSIGTRRYASLEGAAH